MKRFHPIVMPLIILVLGAIVIPLAGPQSSISHIVAPKIAHAQAATSSTAPAVFNGIGGLNSTLYLQNAGTADATTSLTFDQQPVDITDPVPTSGGAILPLADTADPEYAGSAIITSDQPVAGVASLQGDEAADNELSMYATLTDASQEQYLGPIYQNVNGLVSAATLVNDGSDPATVDLTFMDSTGAVVAEETISIDPGTATTITPTPGDVPDGFVGSLMVTADQPVLGIVAQNDAGTATPVEYMAPLQGTRYVPRAHKNAEAGGSTRTTTLFLLNGGTSDATASVIYYNVRGNDVSRTEVNLSPGGSQSINLANETDLPDGTYAVKVEVEGNVSINEYTTFTNPSPFVAGDYMVWMGSELYLPRVVHQEALAYTTISVQNLTSNVAEVELAFYNLDGSLAATPPARTVLPDGLARYDLRDFALAGLGDDFEGVAVISTNQEIAALVDEYRTTVPGAPLDITIAGPRQGSPDTDYEFVAVVSPEGTNQPITYEWQATDLDTQMGSSEGLSDTITLNWPTTGTKYVTVTATNDTGIVVMDTHEIDIGEQTVLESVEIEGETTGSTGMEYDFTAVTMPENVTTPVSYVWEATNQETQTIEDGDRQSRVSFTWLVTGTQTVTVTATNADATVTGTHQIDIAEPGEIQRVEIIGPERGTINTDYSFSAEVVPDDTTTPISYTWEATNQETIVNQSDDVVNIVTFSWPVSGTQSITMTATNATGSVSTTHQISIGDEGEEPVTIESVDIRGPNRGRATLPYEFTAVVSPTNATEPISYTWEASGDANLESQTENTVTFSWGMTGTQTVTVTASNDAGDAVGSTHDILIVGIDEIGPSVEITVTRETSPTLIFTDPTTERDIFIAKFETASVMTDTEVIVRYTDLAGIPNESTSGFVVVGPAFTLEALNAEDRTPLEDFTFEKPLAITIEYDEADVQAAGLAEDDLRLYRWDTASEAWQDAATTCDPTSSYDYRPEEDEYSVTICRFSEFFNGAPAQVDEANRVYLPIIVTQAGTATVVGRILSINDGEPIVDIMVRLGEAIEDAGVWSISGASSPGAITDSVGGFQMTSVPEDSYVMTVGDLFRNYVVIPDPLETNNAQIWHVPWEGIFDIGDVYVDPDKISW